MNPDRFSDAPLLPDVVVLDTCVLISSVLRALLLQLAQEGRLTPVWSTVIGDEWRRTAARLWDASEEDILLQWEALQSAFPKADMGDVSGLKQGLERSDPKDWHVVAAARAAVAAYPDSRVAVITRNVKDFHRAELRRLGIYLFDPDQLLSRLWAHAPKLMARLLSGLADGACPPGRQPVDLQTLLKRERLFRLNRLNQGEV